MSSNAQKKTNTAAEQPARLEQLIGYNLKRAYVIFQNDFIEVLGEDDLAPRVFSALSLVAQYPEISQSDLARMLGIERSGLVAIVDELEKRELITRDQVPGDRRAYALVPTKAGLKLAAAAEKRILKHEEKLLEALSAAEKQTLLGLLGKIRG